MYEEYQSSWMTVKDWCEAQGIDIDGNPIDVEEDEEQQYTDDDIKQDLSEEAQYRRLKMKGRDKYE